MTIKVAIAGINGKMGRASAPAIFGDPDLSLVGAFGRSDAAYVGADIGDLVLGKSLGVKVSRDLEDCLATTAGKPDVLLEFTVAPSALEHARICLSRGVRPLIGTSGLVAADFARLSSWVDEAGLGAMVVPNFSVGAVLMMEFARQAGKHFGHVEVIEMHGTKKVDAPSGTAMYTTRKLAEAANGRTYNPREVQDHELLAGCRGGVTESGVRVHSLRLPGLISHQDVVFGGDGELLSIRHDSFNTNCFLKGILMSIKATHGMKGLTVGLESLL